MTKSLEKAFAKNNTKVEGQTVKKPSRVSISQLYAYSGLAIGLLLGLVAAAFIYKILVADVREQQFEDLTYQYVENASKHVEFQLKKTMQSIEFYTSKNTLVDAIDSQNTAQIARYTKQMLERVKHLAAVDFSKKGEAKRTDSVDPPIRFAELDLVERAERGEIIRPEAVRNNKKNYVNLVLPLLGNNQEIIGTVLLRFDTSVVTQGLADIIGDAGKVIVEQHFENGNANTVAQYGHSTLSKQVERFVSNSNNWQVVFTPSKSLRASLAVDATLAYVLMLLTLLLLSVLGFINGKRIGKQLEKKSEKVVDEIKTDQDAGDTAAVASTADILDIEIAEGDEELLGLADADADNGSSKGVQSVEDSAEESVVNPAEVPEVIFRAYDIRGIAKTQVTTKIAQFVGQALGSEALDNNQDTLIVARDARLSSPELTEWLIRGILSTGCNVLNIGTVPTPLMYFATETLSESQSGVMVTASHNPAEYNGFKVVMNGKCRSGDDIVAIRKRIILSDFYQGSGQEHKHNIIPDYIDTIFSDVALAGEISIVLDAGNAVTGVVAPQLFEELGCNVIPLHCELDGNFPNHQPDPSVASNLQDLIHRVRDEEADLGVAFDGDGDRITVVTPSGKIIWPDRLLMLFAKDIISRNPGADVVFDVKSTRHLSSLVTSFGGRPIMWKTGHSPMKEKMVESGALVGGEFSGHIFIKDRWFGFDDGMYAAARLIEILSLQGEDMDMVFNEFPVSPSTPEIRIAVSEEEKFGYIEKLKEQGEFEGAKLTLIDGVRADFPFGWGLIRASNTSAHLTMRFEADDDGSLHHIKSVLVKELRKIDSSIEIDWNE